MNSNIDGTLNDFFHVVPNPPPTASEYNAHIRRLRNSLLTSNPQLDEKYITLINPYTFHTPPAPIVNNWWTTPRYQEAIPVTPKVERVLRALDIRRPYTDVGCYRPDFLVPQKHDGPLQICEINSRFMFNSYLILLFTGEYFDNNASEEDLRRFQKQSTVQDIKSAFSHLFDATKPVTLLKAREPGWDVHFLPYICNTSRMVDPKSLRLVPCSSSPSGYTLADDIGIIEQVALELHQDELDAIDEQILLEIGARCHNDLRTVFFVHDKRILGLICQELDNLVASGALSGEQAAILRRGIAETHFPGTESFQKIVNEPHNKDMWLIKPCLSAKGDGITFGKDVDQETWKALVNSKLEGHHRLSAYQSKASSQSHFVIQRYLHQRRFIFLMRPDNAGDPPQIVNWLTVGGMMCLNNIFLKPGWRTSPSEITNLTSGELLYSVTSNEEPPSADKPPSSW
ncbi:uncharacterized protein H6S33_009772 [Morchella sextelata]|uniref:uncharacterized protein n=1 Tax=Morchella sextelata TaxID=1174677 RepID=UPI001D0403A5|nr:uncharacterized protein H6S33_009772 [Morchella sextelata]KAH0613392.1 hypothetical protein H6S33_009772 [Morchella sextelata]